MTEAKQNMTKANPHGNEKTIMYLVLYGLVLTSLTVLILFSFEICAICMYFFMKASLPENNITLVSLF